MTKEEMRKAIDEGMKLYFANGKAITKVPEAAMQVRKRQIKQSDEFVQIDVKNLPPSLKERFSFKD